MLGLPAGCRPPESADPPILSLGDQTVRRSEFERHVSNLEQQGGSPLDPTVRAALLERFLEERVVVLEARARGLVSAKSTPEQEETAARKLLADEGLSGVEIKDEEVAAYYAARPDEFRSPETVSLRQILVPTMNEARDVRRRLLKDPRSFPALAQTPSREPSLEESREEIRSRLRRQKVDHRVQQFVAGLMARAKVNHEAAQSSSHR